LPLANYLFSSSVYRAYITHQNNGGIVLKRVNLTFVILVVWCILVLTYFAVWKNNWFILISTNALLLLKLYLDYKLNKK
jgi:hypothetical protein